MKHGECVRVLDECAGLPVISTQSKLGYDYAEDEMTKQEGTGKVGVGPSEKV